MKWEIPFTNKLSSSWLGIHINHSSTKMDPISKTIYRKVGISLANNLYDKLEDIIVIRYISEWEL